VCACVWQREEAISGVTELSAWSAWRALRVSSVSHSNCALRRAAAGRASDLPSKERRHSSDEQAHGMGCSVDGQCSPCSVALCIAVRIAFVCTPLRPTRALFRKNENTAVRS
jgi:hypothetical protein